jgi:molybdate transport system substrate-binding protein
LTGLLTRAVALLLVLLAVPGVAAAAELTVFCPRDVQHAVAAAAEEFQHATRHSVWMSYGTTGALAVRARTEEADIVIGSVAGLAELETQGAVRPGTRVVLGRVRIGVAVRAGATVDVSTMAKLRRAILEAPSLGYADPERGAQAGRHFARVLESMAIAPLVSFKTTVFPDGLRALEAVAKGQIAVAVAPVSEILAVAGVTLSGPLPDDAQQVLVYAAGVMTRSAAPDVASAFLTHLASADVQRRFRAGGIEPGD